MRRQVFINSVWIVGNYMGSAGTARTLAQTLTPPNVPTPIASYYVKTTDRAKHQAAGLATDAAEGVIILDYGMPYLTSQGEYGALLLTVHTEVGASQIADDVEGFLDGYHIGWCQHHGSYCRPDAPPNPPVAVTVSIGINNTTIVADGVQRWDGQLNAAHAAHWASLVSSVRDYINTHEYKEIKVAAAMDIEPGYTDYYQTSTWTNKYKTSGVSTYYNFGSTDSYPCDTTTRVPPPLSCAGDNNNGWFIGNIYDVSWLGARALPEIYSNNSCRGILEARYWYAVKRWSYDNHKSLLQFSGTSTDDAYPCSTHLTESSRGFWLQLNGDQATAQPIPLSVYYTNLQ